MPSHPPPLAVAACLFVAFAIVAALHANWVNALLCLLVAAIVYGVYLHLRRPTPPKSIF